MSRTALVILFCSALCAPQHKAFAQFYKPVVRLMGTVTGKNGKAVVARVSVRDAADTTIEIAGSNSNSVTGKYLTILKPEQKYVVVVRGDSLVPQTVKIVTPAADHNTDFVQNFTVQLAQPVHKQATKALKAVRAKKPAKKKK